ncbi:MAG: transketolase [Candidatus Spechtbacteria bacterium RIFCSPLOWO2_12_FULL_38_22]|uniref:Transketolase n=1 Tax=Candidatus Spechtbacteria bacterium RIFCSPLOWO2_12_FULL_38_22 TaxID=1802165 RepID=A0A1G2HGR0_9BACT|nr:MAG: transketolase [Candidatus Spechtbacteria bacterium RIFCSPHIGHO2_12_FULL_38_30]OGZ59677.1 MAG: transketolase [Candidatus Spechtbacteria bacterium RIFCSPLOWO2_01_FULL_38_20]OGZ61684.1 MAG: transketolase [Candidatus Spechtbacteria bacterium RIFCSPLOWO2_12_FULL_38_22]
MSIHSEKIKVLEKKANEIRIDLMKMLEEAGSGHSGGPLGMADIFTAFYFHILNHRPREPRWEKRDRLILSNGHIVPVRYVTMHHAGYDITKEELMTLRKIGSRLEGHPNIHRIPALETTSGPLGEGLSQACGMAMARRFRNQEHEYTIYCFMSDGEQQEGMTLEAVMFAGKQKFDNFIGLIDRNNIQIDGFTEDIMPLEPLREKYEAFGWHVMEMNAHNIAEIVSTVEEAKAVHQKPVLIIAHTIPGKGVDFMEDDYRWHGVPPGAGPEDEVKRKDQLKEALRELRTLGGKIEHGE